MTEEEFFRKNYPDSCYGDKPLSPYYDFFQDGVEFGERQSEKKIEELEKEIAELKCECRRCVYTDSPCVLSDYGKDRNGICDHFKDVFDKNAELKTNFKIAKDNEYEYQSLLIKAKEYIKLLLMNCVGVYESTGKTIAEIQAEAEQFISEVEK